MDMSSKFLFFSIASRFAPIHTPCGHYEGLVPKFFNYPVQPDYIFDNEQTLTHSMEETMKSAYPLFLMTFLESNIGRICVSRQETIKGKLGFARRSHFIGGRSAVGKRGSRDMDDEVLGQINTRAPVRSSEGG